ncbi:unnamed protein product [Urochloa humidicola]
MDDAVPHVRPWVILCRILRRVPGGAPAAGVAEAGEEPEAGDEEAELEAGAEHAADFSIPLVVPPRVTVMNAGPTADPDPDSPDKYPYVLGAESDMLLLNFAVEPFYGVCLNDRPYQSNLIVVRDFDAAGVAQGRPLTGTAERIPPRNGEQPVVTNLESVGLLSTPGPDAVDRFLIAELLVNRGNDTARLVYIFADGDFWIQEDVPNPLLGHGDEREGEWVPSGVICHIAKLWWFDLSWGLISFNHMAEVDNEPLVLFHALPEGRALDMAQPGIHNTRCIAESEGQLLFVEIITDDPDGDAEAARVCVWTRTAGDGNVTIGWAVEHKVGFEEIWNHDSYIETGLPRKVPVLVAVSPSNVDHVYFVLQEEERLFCLDLLMRTVAEFVDEDYDLVTPWPVPPSCRYVLPWIVPLVQVPQDGNSDVEEEVVHIAEGMANDEEEIHEEILEEEELVLLEQLNDDAEEIIAEAPLVFQALAQGAQAAEEASDDDEELQEGEIDDEEQLEAEIQGDDEEQLEAEIQGDDEEQPEAEIDDEEQLEAEIQGDDEEQPEAEIDDEEQLEAEIQGDDEEQPEAEIDDEEQLEAEIQGDDEEQPEAKIDGDNETSSEENMNLAIRMDPETASRLKAEVKEYLSDMKDYPGPSQDPGEGAV